jgi:peptidoglycan/LPS O-acetylase OafA/YrhL
MVEPLEAGAFIILVARTATGFDGYVARFLTLPGLVFAGRISYGLYIYHILVVMLFQRWLPLPLQWLLAIPSVRLVILGTSTLLVAAMSWRILEQPLNRFRGEKIRDVPGPLPNEDSPLSAARPLAQFNWTYRLRKGLLPS